MARIWNLRLNLDEFNAAIMSVLTDQDKSLMLQGMSLGFNGGTFEAGSNHLPASFEAGYQMAIKSRREAESFAVAMSESGRKSSNLRKEKYGTAQPPNVDRTTFEPPSSQDRTRIEPILNPQSKELVPSPSAQSGNHDSLVAKPKTVRVAKSKDSGLPRPSTDAFNTARSLISIFGAHGSIRMNTAAQSIADAIDEGHSHQDIIEGAKRYIASVETKDPKYRLHMATFVKERSWMAFMAAPEEIEPAQTWVRREDA